MKWELFRCARQKTTTQEANNTNDQEEKIGQQHNRIHYIESVSWFCSLILTDRHTDDAYALLQMRKESKQTNKQTKERY